MRSKMDNSLSKKERQKKAREEMEDVDFIAAAEVPEAQSMESLNLFGVPLDTLSELSGGKKESIKEKNDKRRFVRELIEVMQALDTDNAAQDFATPKTFINFDPFASEDSLDQTGSALKYEDNMKLRASLGLDVYEKSLDAIDQSKLSYQDNEKL